MPYYAHTAPDGRKQLQKDHAQNVAEIAAAFAQTFHGMDTAYAAGLLHDIGKYSKEAQTYLLTNKRVNGQIIDHSTAGAAECFDAARNQQELGYLISAFSIAGHHAGLPDKGSQTNASTDSTLWGRYNRKNEGKIPDYSAYRTEITFPQAPHMPTQDIAELSMYIRMVFSCLVDADFLDTETFFDGQSRPSSPADFHILLKNLNRFTAPWQVPTNPLNKRRQEILNTCHQKGKSLDKGLFTLTVPTGGGKTIASLAFALEHAVKHNMSHVIYVIPYTSIIDQTADIFRKAIGGNHVLEHHSNKLYDPDENNDTLRMAKATENWDMPVIVTTSVQFFESLYACKTGRCRKLHNIADSVIIFDEAQLLPLAHLRPCVYAIDQLVKNYGCSAILCTATQPALDPIFQEFDPGRTITELCPTRLSKDRIFQRVQYKYADTTTPDELTDELTKRKQVLCVVNKRKTAQNLYEKLKHLPGTFHLSTFMYPEHRRNILKKIKQRLYHHKPCRVISTSLIEAGVDLDFPVVFREETGLDSILQAGGRANRNGKSKATQSPVIIFRFDETAKGDLSRRIVAFRQVVKKYKRIDSKEAITEYFRIWRDLSGPSLQDSKHILDLSSNLRFREIGTSFHLISDSSYIIYIPANEKIRRLLEQLENHQASLKTYRRLHNYIVPVYQQQYQSLLSAGFIRPLDENTAILNDMSLYQDDIGLPYDIKQEPLII